MRADWQDGEYTDIIPVPIDEQTVERLCCLSRIIGTDPLSLAASLLKHLVDDDYAEHIEITH